MALVCWGFGDFLIQRSARKFGDWIALFYITAFGAIILFPFIYRDLISSFTAHSPLLWITSFVILFAALLDFEALKVGKISVIEPIYALEIPVTAFLGTYIAKEHLSPEQNFLIIILIMGIILISTQSFSYFKKFTFERGVWYALLATIGMGSANFLFGISSRETSPLLVNWFTNLFIAVIAFLYLLFNSRLKEMVNDVKNNHKLILSVSLFDNLAWITFSYATLYIPIAIATGISEGYIAFAGGLGLLFNKEKLKTHQWVGFVVTIISVVILAFTTQD